MGGEGGGGKGHPMQAAVRSRVGRVGRAGRRRDRRGPCLPFRVRAGPDRSLAAAEDKRGARKGGRICFGNRGDGGGGTGEGGRGRGRERDSEGDGGRRGRARTVSR